MVLSDLKTTPWNHEWMACKRVDAAELDTVSTPKSYSTSQVASTGSTPASSMSDLEYGYPEHVNGQGSRKRALN